MSLGASFPAAFRRQALLRQLTPGTFIKLVRTMDDGNTKEKRFLVVHVADDSLMCVVNSEVGKFIASRPAMAKCQVALPVAEHPFMSHDSFIDCSKAVRYQTADVINDLMARPEWVLGTLSAATKQQVLAALKAGPPGITQEDVLTICASLEAVF